LHPAPNSFSNRGSKQIAHSACSAATVTPIKGGADGAVGITGSATGILLDIALLPASR